MYAYTVLLGYLSIMQYDATLLGSKGKCKKMEEVPWLNLRLFLLFKTKFYLIKWGNTSESSIEQYVIHK